MRLGGPRACPEPVERGPALRALIRWQHFAGPFWPYVSATPFLSATSALNGSILEPRESGLFPRAGEALFLDLPPMDILGLVPAPHRDAFLVVPIIQRWCADPAVIPSAGLVGALLAVARRLRRPREPRSALFLLDGDRRGPKRPKLDRFDNRYFYNLNALPPAEVLQRQGITEARLVSRGAPAQDLWGYIQALKRGGVDVMLSEVRAPSHNKA